MLGEDGWLMRAAREQRCQHHQVRQREQPLLRLRSCRFRCSRDHAQMTATCEIVQMLHTNPRQAGHFRVRKDFLTGLNFYQGASLFLFLFHLLTSLMLRRA
jgi:hypothetical protein